MKTTEERTMRKTLTMLTVSAALVSISHLMRRERSDDLSAWNSSRKQRE